MITVCLDGCYNGHYDIVEWLYNISKIDDNIK